MAISRLHQVLLALTHQHRFRILIHDLSGILNHPALQLPVELKTHSHSFCTHVKSTPAGYRNCLRCKALALRRAQREPGAFSGMCYMGQPEWICPVRSGDRLLCVIFISNLRAADNAATADAMARRSAQRTGTDFRRLSRFLSGMEPFDSLPAGICMTLFSLISGVILQEAAGQMPEKQRHRTDAISFEVRHWAVDALMNDIHLHYNRDLHLSRQAALYFMNPEYLCRLFRKEAGMTFTDYLHHVRIQAARRLLTETQADITDIGLQVGYPLPAYFHRRFKRHTGLTPGEYRRQSRPLP